jgi:CubicO group peptidase (beta-lactamase class C family)
MLLDGIESAPELRKMDFDRIALESLLTWSVPGAAVVVVRDGTVVHLGGYGQADVVTRRPVTPDTIFAIASCTKAVAATACSLLVQEGRLGWDDKVRRHLPRFQMGDRLADAEVTIRDLMCHRTGLGNHDLLWRLAPWDFDESMRRLAFLDIDAPFRTRFDYNNFLYIVLGHAISAAAGEPWHEFVRRRLFEPLGMTRSVFSAIEAQGLADAASPHRRRHGELQRLSEPHETACRASGSIRSCVRDLGTWMHFQLSGGVGPNGDRLLAAEHLAETHTPQIVHRPAVELAAHAGTIFSSYGMGWHILDYRGHHLIEHTGGLGGYRAFVALQPEQRCGVAVVANLRMSDMAIAMGRRMLDILLGLPGEDWDRIYLERERQDDESYRLNETRRDAGRHGGTRTSRELAAYVGTYAEPAYGELAVGAVGAGTLELRWSSLRVRLEHFHYDTFTAREDDPDVENPLDGLTAVFHLRADGQVGEIEFLRRHFRRIRDDS